MHMLEQIGLRTLVKFRAYYCPAQKHSEENQELLDDEEFVMLLQAIDSFSGELMRRSLKERIPEKPIRLP